MFNFYLADLSLFLLPQLQSDEWELSRTQSGHTLTTPLSQHIDVLSSTHPNHMRVFSFPRPTLFFAPGLSYLPMSLPSFFCGFSSSIYLHFSGHLLLSFHCSLALFLGCGFLCFSFVAGYFFSVVSWRAAGASWHLGRLWFSSFSYCTTTSLFCAFTAFGSTGVGYITHTHLQGMLGTRSRCICGLTFLLLTPARVVLLAPRSLRMRRTLGAATKSLHSGRASFPFVRNRL